MLNSVSKIVAAVTIICLYIADSLDNGVARTPPMGWDTYNGFHGDYNDELLEMMADLLVSTGMKDAGYNRINIDGGWAWFVNTHIFTISR